MTVTPIDSVPSEIGKRKPLPYTLRIGVTGHRDLKDPNAVGDAVKATLNHIEKVLWSAATEPYGRTVSERGLWRRAEISLLGVFKRILPSLPFSDVRTPHPMQTPLRWQVVSALARGTDRIVANAVLQRADAELEAVIPFEIDEYRKDFSTSDDLEEFNNLLKHDETPRELKHDYAEASPADTPEECERKKVIRDQGYLSGGKWVVDTCEILIAVWDGAPAKGKGGTEEVVQYAIDQERIIFWIDARNPAAPAKLIAGRDEQTGDLKLEPLPNTADRISVDFLQLCAYNRDVVFRTSEYNAIFRKNEERLRKAQHSAGLPDSILTPLFDVLLPHYSRADQLAVRYQTFHIKTASTIYCLAATAVSIGVVQHLYLEEQLWLILFEILAMVAAVIFLRVSVIEAWHDKWLHYRHLAERLRTTKFTLLLGPTGRDRSTEHPLPFYPGPGNWVVNAIDSIRSQIPMTSGVGASVDQIKKFVLAGWIGDQVEWHRDNSGQKRTKARHEHLMGLAFFVGTLVMACLHWAGICHPGNDWLQHGMLCPGRLIIALAIILPAFAGTVHAVSSIHDYDRIAARSARMGKILGRIANAIEKAVTVDDLRREVSRAEEVMSVENHEWCVSLSFRRVILPV